MQSKKYLHILKLSVSETLAYRANIFLEMAGTAILMFFTIAIWRAFFNASGGAEIRGYTFPEMISYLLLGMFFAMTILNSSEGDDVNDEINDGRVSLLLVKPVAPPFYWFIRDSGRRLVQLVLGVLALASLTLSVDVLFTELITLQSIFIACIFFIIASVLHFLIFFNFSVIAFWLEQTWGERFLIRAMLEIAGGLYIPLSLFPSFWREMFEFLPFKFFISVPIQVVLGKIASYELFIQAVQLVVWVILFGVLSAVFWYRGVRQYDGSSN